MGDGVAEVGVRVKHRQIHRPDGLAEVLEVGRDRIGQARPERHADRGGVPAALDQEGDERGSGGQGEEGHLLQKQAEQGIYDLRFTIDELGLGREA